MTTTAGAAVDANRAPFAGALFHLDGLLFPGEKTYTSAELAQAAGVDEALTERLWWAMGFAPVGPDERHFVDDDLRALELAARALQDLAPIDQVVYQTRVMAAALSRVAEVVADNIVNNIAAARASGLSDEEIATRLTSPDAEEINQLIGYVYRRQLRAALWRKLADPDRLGEHAEQTVGFVDLVRFTAITEDIEEDLLAGLIDRFDTTAHDSVTSRGGRIVKMIGDEVMFVTDEPPAAVAIALHLVSTLRDDPSMPPARAGVAAGRVLAYGGDCFGPVVNLASRIVDVAHASTVVVSQGVHETMANDPGLHWRRLPPKRLKGIGRAQLYAVS